jgi:hypothetical protein
MLDTDAIRSRAQILPDIDLPVELSRADEERQAAQAKYEILLAEVLRRGRESPHAQMRFCVSSDGTPAYANTELLRVHRFADKADQNGNASQSHTAQA